MCNPHGLIHEFSFLSCGLLNSITFHRPFWTQCEIKTHAFRKHKNLFLHNLTRDVNGSPEKLFSQAVEAFLRLLFNRTSDAVAEREGDDGGDCSVSKRTNLVNLAGPSAARS